MQAWTKGPFILFIQAMMALAGISYSMMVCSSFSRAQKRVIKMGFSDDINTYIMISGGVQSNVIIFHRHFNFYFSILQEFGFLPLPWEILWAPLSQALLSTSSASAVPLTSSLPSTHAWLSLMPLTLSRRWTDSVGLLATRGSDEKPGMKPPEN